MKIAIALAAVLVAVSQPVMAQSRSISPGMTTDQVRAAFGAPATTRDTGDWTYWYYHNGCPRRCGSDDVVFFREGQVVAAVLRTSARRFSGPAADQALERYDDVSAAGGVETERPVNMGRIGNPREENADEGGTSSAGGRAGEPARVGGVRVTTPEGEARGEGEGSTTIIRRRDAGAARTEPLRRGEAEEVSVDTIQGEATRVDDERREREGRVEPNTIRTSPDTLNADRRVRERRVQPRVIPRP